jgi:hypothetical protein
MADEAKILKIIERCEDPEKLKTLRKNASDHGAAGIADAAFRKLISVLPSEKPGTVEHDFWQTVHAFELALSEERGRTTRLSRTRQKVTRVGVIQTLRDWALTETETQGFRMLLERGMPELTGEAIVLRHTDSFGPDIMAAAKKRLEDAGVDVGRLPSG